MNHDRHAISETAIVLTLPLGFPRPTQARRRRRAFTLIELLVVIAIIMMLAALALPVLMQTVRQARGVSCMGNLRQLAVAFRNYVNAFDGLFCGTEACKTASWAFHTDPDTGPLMERPNGWDICPTGGQIYRFYRDPLLVLCPADHVGRGNGKLSYSVPVINRYRLYDEVPNSAETLLVMEEHPAYNIGGHNNRPYRREGGFACSDRPAVRHGGKAANAWFDGHAALTQFPDGTTASDFNQRIWKEINSDQWRYNCGQDYRPPHMK